MACRPGRRASRAALPPTAAELFRLWSAIGLKSVGGGQAVQFYAFESLVNERRWLTFDSWAESWGLSQVVPGISVIAVAGVTGVRIAGVPGAVASLAGLMLPSVVATVVIAALYTRIAQLPGVAGALRGMFVAVTGTALVLNWRVGRPLVRSAAARSATVAIITTAIPVVAGTLVFTGRVPVFAVLLGAATLLALLWWRSSPSHD